MLEIGSFIEGREGERNKDFSLMQIVKSEVGDQGIHFLCSGREAISAAIEDIEMRNKNLKQKCLLPLYICDSVISPFVKYGWDLCFYPVETNFEINLEVLSKIVENEKPTVLLVQALYGTEISLETKKNLKNYRLEKGIIIIEDLTQTLTSVRQTLWCDYRIASLRKWFAIPDGGFIIADHSLKIKVNREKYEYVRLKREALELKALYLKDNTLIDKKIFLQKNNFAEEYLYQHMEICKMSKYSLREIEEINAEYVLKKRNENAKFLLESLKGVDCVRLIERNISAPLYFPIFVNDRKELQTYLIKNGIYTSILWSIPQRVCTLLNESTLYIYRHLLCIPCDQRYGKEDMKKIVYYIEQYGGTIN